MDITIKQDKLGNYITPAEVVIPQYDIITENDTLQVREAKQIAQLRIIEEHNE